MDIGHHRRKWKSPILGVAQVVLRDVFLALIFLAYVEPFFFCFHAGKFSSAAPSPVLAVSSTVALFFVGDHYQNPEM